MLPMVALASFVALAPSTAVDAALDRFSGRWELRGSSDGGAKATTYRISEDCRWSGERTFMICEQNAHGRRVSDVTLMWRDEAGGAYRFTGINVSGSGGSGTIRISEHLWIWNSVDGSHRYRTLNRWTTLDHIDYVSESSADRGKTWTRTGHGTEIRVR